MGVLSIDSNTPATVYSATAPVTTASFTPPANALFVVAWCGNTPAGGDTGPPSITDSLVSHLTYTQLQHTRRADGLSADRCATMFWAETTSAPGAMTISLTTVAATTQSSVKVWILTDDSGTAPSIGASAKGAQISGTTVAATVTATSTGGWTFAVIDDWDANGVPTAGAGTTISAGDAADQGTVISYAYARRTTADAVSGSPNTVNVGLPGGSADLGWVAAEVVPVAGAAPPQLGAAAWPAPGVWPQSMRGPFPYLSFTPDPRSFDSTVGFQPSDIPGLAGWWKADALVLSNGASVSSWIDSSGGGHTATQATGGAQPTYQANVLNGQPVVRFDGTDDVLDVTIVDDAQPSMWFAVFKTSDSLRTVQIFQSGQEVLRHENGNLILAFAGTDSWNTYTHDGSAYQILSTVFNGASSAFRVNGDAAGQSISPGTNGTGTVLRFGGHTSLSRFLAGDIAEIIHYSRELTTVERTSVDTYLSVKYGINLGALPTSVTALTTVGIGAAATAQKVAPVTARPTAGIAATLATQKVATRSGLSTVGAAAVTTAKKVAPVPGLSTMGLASTVASRKVAPKTAQAFAGLAAMVTGKKVSADTALSALGVAATAIRVPVTAVVARMAMGLASAVSIKKVAADTALSTLGAAATVASRKVVPQTGRAALGLAERASVVKVSTPAARAFTGLHVTAATVRRALPSALAAMGVESFALRAQGTLVTARSALGFMARAAVAKTAAPTGAALLGLRQTVTAKHVGILSGQSTLGVTGTAAAVKRSISAARLLYGLTTLGTGRRVALPTARTYVGLWTGIDLSAITARDIELILGTPEFHWNIGAVAPAWSTEDIQAKWRIITDLAIRWDADDLELKWHSGSAQL